MKTHSLCLVLIPRLTPPLAESHAIEPAPGAKCEIPRALQALHDQVIRLRPFWRVYAGLKRPDLTEIARLLVKQQEPIHCDERLDGSTKRQPLVLGAPFLGDLVSAWHHQNRPAGSVVVIGDEAVIRVIADRAAGHPIHCRGEFWELEIPEGRISQIYTSDHLLAPLPPQ